MQIRTGLVSKLLLIAGVATIVGGYSIRALSSPLSIEPKTEGAPIDGDREHEIEVSVRNTSPFSVRLRGHENCCSSLLMLRKEEIVPAFGARIVKLAINPRGIPVGPAAFTIALDGLVAGRYFEQQHPFRCTVERRRQSP